MNIPNERKILPIVRNAVKGDSLQEFIEMISAEFDCFVSSGKESDNYKGWSFDIEFQSARSDGYKEFTLSDSEINYLPKTNDDCSIVISGKGLINIHLHSFLWR